ncbi:hypothetical protein U9M48_036409 [Paspalum notatum var. saurae]|uniref:Uncharacterized protein n=1 Tax=Paspalum notatum var. saurae TaxID=547442 RepID=A0AAQ3UD41_PASNO
MKMDDTRPKSGDEINRPTAGGRPTQCQVGQPPGRKHIYKSIQPLYLASNVSKSHKTTKLRIHDVTNPREEPCGQSKADTWVARPPLRSADLLSEAFYTCNNCPNRQPPWGCKIKLLECKGSGSGGRPTSG